MSESNSTAIQKPAKPHPDFPLFAHAAGYWAKKIRGRLVYFGSWSDPDAALRKYMEQKDALHKGMTPRPDTTEPTVKDACNAFLNAKQNLVNSGELSPRTWAGYKEAADEVIAAFGKRRLLADLRASDFATLRTRLAKRWGPSWLGVGIQCIRSLFKYAFDSELIDRPVRCGPDFKRPSKAVMRKHKAKQGPKLFTADEIRRLINAASPQLQAMILLAINCGFGNADCGRLPTSAVDLEEGWVDFPRPKTGVARRCPLWAETVKSLDVALACRPHPKDKADDGLVFLTAFGQPWHRDTSDNPLTKEMAKLLKKLHINGRNGLGFYSLRHTFRTVADATKDQPACDFIMGHSRETMASVYRQDIDDDRLVAVAAYVRRWLFGNGATPPAAND